MKNICTVSSWIILKVCSLRINMALLRISSIVAPTGGGIYFLMANNASLRAVFFLRSSVASSNCSDALFSISSSRIMSAMCEEFMCTFSRPNSSITLSERGGGED